MYFDLEMYIVLCKGNVYQSCGDDEQSMLHYMEGFSKADDRSFRNILLFNHFYQVLAGRKRIGR